MKKNKREYKRKNKTILPMIICGILLTSGVVSAESKNIMGTLAEGVESGCIILNGDDGNIYQLYNLSNDIPPFGSRVYANGTIEPDVVSFCMQGTSLKVLEIHVIPGTNGDILAYYRGLGQFPNIVETNDLLKAIDDWRDNVIPTGFSVCITTDQLLTLAEEYPEHSAPGNSSPNPG